MELVSRRKERVRTRRSITTNEITIRSAKRYTDGMKFEQSSKMGAAKLPATANIITKKTEEATETPKTGH